MKNILIILALSVCSLTAQNASRPLYRGNAPAFNKILTINNSLGIIPESRLWNMQQIVGVEGGIPARTTYITLSSTVTVAQINGHISACPSNQQIALLNGSYDWSGSTINFKSGVSFIGQGSNTIVRLPNNCKIGPSLPFSNITSMGTNLLNSGFEIGSSNLVTATTTFLNQITNGSVIYISELNDTNIVHPWGYEIVGDPATGVTDGDYPYSQSLATGIRNRGQGFRVTSINGNNVGIWPPITGRGYKASLNPAIHYALTNSTSANNNNVCYVGFRDMTLTNNAGNMFQLDMTQNIWFSNVTFSVSTADTPALLGYYTHRVSVQGCNFFGYGTSPAAILCYCWHSGWLIENNFFKNYNQSVFFKGAGGFSVVLYNFSSTTNVTTAIISETGSHAANTQFVYYEGNDFRKAQWDNSHGSSGDVIFFRNRARGQESFTTFGYGSFSIDNFIYNASFVGNELGVSNLTTGYLLEVFCPSPSQGSSQVHWRIGYSGYNPTNISDVVSSLIRSGNVDFIGGTPNVRWANTSNSRVLTNSYYYTSKPYFFGATQPWPLFGPDTSYINYTPAEYRLTNGFATPP